MTRSRGKIPRGYHDNRISDHGLRFFHVYIYHGRQKKMSKTKFVIIPLSWQALIEVETALLLTKIDTLRSDFLMDS